MDLKSHLYDKYSRRLKEISDLKSYPSNGFSDIKNYPIMKGVQGLYVMNWGISRITYAKGIEEMTGYSMDEFEQNATGSFIHPNDRSIVERIIQGAMDHMIDHLIDTSGVQHLMTYRIRKKNGDYIKVLRKTTPYERDSNNIMISSVSMLTDITFINKSNKVDWYLDIDKLDIDELRNKIQKRFLGFFSEREMEIISMIREGFSSKQISQKKHISVHTVNTHRRNILSKSGCHSSSELLAFCRQNGLI